MHSVSWTGLSFVYTPFFTLNKTFVVAIVSGVLVLVCTGLQLLVKFSRVLLAGC